MAFHPEWPSFIVHGPVASGWVNSKKENGASPAAFLNIVIGRDAGKGGTLENAGIDPATSRMLSERSTI